MKVSLEGSSDPVDLADPFAVGPSAYDLAIRTLSLGIGGSRQCIVILGENPCLSAQ
jgi:hypothetical protein